MKNENFPARFRRLTAGISDTELARTMDMSISAVVKLRRGEIATLRIGPALRLCERLGCDPWLLAFGEDDVTTAPLDDVKAYAGRLRALETRVNRQSEQIAALASAGAATAEALVGRAASKTVSRKRSVGRAPRSR